MHLISIFVYLFGDFVSNTRTTLFILINGLMVFAGGVSLFADHGDGIFYFLIIKLLFLNEKCYWHAICH